GLASWSYRRGDVSKRTTRTPPGGRPSRPAVRAWHIDIELRAVRVCSGIARHATTDEWPHRNIAPQHLPRGAGRTVRRAPRRGGASDTWRVQRGASRSRLRSARGIADFGRPVDAKLRRDASEGPRIGSLKWHRANWP